VDVPDHTAVGGRPVDEIRGVRCTAAAFDPPARLAVACGEHRDRELRKTDVNWPRIDAVSPTTAILSARLLRLAAEHFLLPAGNRLPEPRGDLGLLLRHRLRLPGI